MTGPADWTDHPWTIGVCAVGYNPEREAAEWARPERNTVLVTVVWDYGWTETWATVQHGTAAEEHAALAKRWRDAGRTFTRDKAACTLTRTRVEPLPHTEIVQHIDGEHAAERTAWQHEVAS